MIIFVRGHAGPGPGAAQSTGAHEEECSSDAISIAARAVPPPAAAAMAGRAAAPPAGSCRGAALRADVNIAIFPSETNYFRKMKLKVVESMLVSAHKPHLVTCHRLMCCCHNI